MSFNIAWCWISWKTNNFIMTYDDDYLFFTDISFKWRPLWLHDVENVIFSKDLTLDIFYRICIIRNIRMNWSARYILLYYNFGLRFEEISRKSNIELDKFRTTWYDDLVCFYINCGIMLSINVTFLKMIDMMEPQCGHFISSSYKTRIT